MTVAGVFPPRLYSNTTHTQYIEALGASQPDDPAPLQVSQADAHVIGVSFETAVALVQAPAHSNVVHRLVEKSVVMLFPGNMAGLRPLPAPHSGSSIRLS